jgi:WD40 repeat protein/nucleoside phosphorylase
MSGNRFDYSSERQRHEKFVARAGLLSRLDQLLVDSETDRWVVITGGPGMGKSALLAAWLARRVAAGVAVPHHFIRRGMYDWDDPAKLVGSLVAQLEDGFPELREADADERMHPATRLARALSRVSENVLRPRGERMVILIDGLDEYDPPVGVSAGDPLAAFLPDALPPGVRLLCASRPRHPYVSSLEARDGELVQIDLDDPSNAADNDATVRAFWEGAAEPLALYASFVNEAVTCAGGNVQHAVQLRKHLAVLPPDQRRVEDIPRGLAALIEKSWGRIALDGVVVDGLGILCVAREALTLDELGTVAGWTGDAQRRTFVRSARELLVETKRLDGQPEYRLHHDSIRGHIAGAIGEAALRAYHGALARRHAIWPAPGQGAARRYALRHGLIHRAEAGAWADAWQLAADMSFLEMKCRELGTHETEADVTRISELCRASGDAVVSRRFSDLARALVRESHWLRVAPEATAALLWNRLRRSGWNTNDIDEQLHVPAERASFLRVRNVITHQSPALVRDLVGHTGAVTACAATTDGRRVISASDDGTLKVWDLKSGRALATFEGHVGGVTACAVTAGGRRVVSASDDGTLKVWDLESGRALATLKDHGHRITACAVTADGRRVISASWNWMLKVWDLESGRTLATFEGHTDTVRACVVTADGRRVISASEDGTLRVWNLEAGPALATLKGHTAGVTACAVTADGRRVISASADRTLKVWDLESGRVLATLEGHTDTVRACAVMADGRRMLSASDDKTLKVWDLEIGPALGTLKGHTAGLTACVLTADGRRVVSASADRTLKLWDLETGPVLATLEGHTDTVRACAVTVDGQRVVSASDDKTLKVWDLESGRALATLEGHTLRVNACAVTADGRRVVSASNDRTLRVWDPESRHVFAILKGHTDWVNACAVTADGRRVVSASADQTLTIWDLESGHVFATLKDHTGAVTACAVTADGRRLVSASWDRTLKMWGLDSGHALATLAGHTGPVMACAATADGRRLVSSSDDGMLKIWDLERGCVLATLAGHTSIVMACAVTTDGQRVVSASYDGTLKVWDLETYACLLTHRGDAPYHAVATSATAIVAGDEAGALWFLDWPPSTRGAQPHRASASDDSQGGSHPANTASPSSLMKKHTIPAKVSSTLPTVDIAILTIRDDEFRAVLGVFPTKVGRFEGTHREYDLRHADAGNGDRYTVTVLRHVDKGMGEAQSVARDVIEDLAPKLVLVVGIGGGLPSDDVKLGDVILSTRIHDFTVEARKTGQKTTYAATGGPIDKALAAAIANLASREDELGDWTTDLPPQPAVSWARKGQLYGPLEWKRELRSKLERHHGKTAMPRVPVYVAGPIASSDRLVKDPTVLFPWLATARDLLAVEMEAGGVYRAARERCPMLAIRGISDIIGLRRSDAWTKFACASAAAFTRAFLRTRPVPVGLSPAAADPR